MGRNIERTERKLEDSRLALKLVPPLKELPGALCLFCIVAALVDFRPNAFINWHETEYNKENGF